MSTGKFARRAAVALTIVVCSFAFAASADKGDASRSARSAMVNSVIVESQTLMIGVPGSVVGVSISNTSPIAGLVLPLEIRPLNPGASVAQRIDFVLNSNGRVANSPLGYADPSPDSLWPEAFMTFHRSCVTCSVACSGPIANTYCAEDTSCSFPINPYGLFFSTVSSGSPQNGESISMDPGSDPGTTADASLQIILTQIGSTPGFFEIDTCCWTPANHIAFAAESGAITSPAFTKGLIEIRCDCSCHADPVCDGIINIQDVVQMVNVLFRDYLPGPHPYCPVPLEDVNCSGITDIVDLVSVIDVGFRDADPDTTFCNACAL